MKQIEEYWPLVLQEIEELQEIANTENIEIDELKESVSNLIDDQFIETATEKGIRRRERLLGITPSRRDDLEYRRFRVLVRWNDRLPYTYRVLKNRLDQIFKDNYKLEILHDQYLLIIEVNTFNWQIYSDIVDDIRKMAPANMVIQSSLVQKVEGSIFVGSTMLVGEEITVYPWSATELTGTGKVYIATGHGTGVDITTLYPKGE